MTDTKPIVGDNYLHTDSQGRYAVLLCLPIKLNGKWVTDGLVVYQSLRTGDQFSRLTPDFMDAFEPIATEKPIDPLSPDQYEQTSSTMGS